eukprot:1192542-Prorocentrum_minimum.AAC.1
MVPEHYFTADFTVHSVVDNPEYSSQTLLSSRMLKRDKVQITKIGSVKKRKKRDVCHGQPA